jgi:hypothetical protein
MHTITRHHLQSEDSASDHSLSPGVPKIFITPKIQNLNRETSLLEKLSPHITSGRPSQGSFNSHQSTSPTHNPKPNTAAQAQAQDLESPTRIFSEILKQPSMPLGTGYWNEFLACVKQSPSSSHGQCVVPWDVTKGTFNLDPLQFYLPPGVESQLVGELFEELSTIEFFNPKKLTSRLSQISMLIAAVFLTVFIAVLTVGLFLDYTATLIYIIPVYLVLLVLGIYGTRVFAVKWLTKKHKERLKNLQAKLAKWDFGVKGKKMNLRWVVGKFGAWLELRHDTKEYGVYTDFAKDRGFSADSDVTPTNYSWSPVKINGLKNKLGHKDSWSAFSASQNTPDRPNGGKRIYDVSPKFKGLS